LVEKIKSPTIGGLSDLRDDYISGLWKSEDCLGRFSASFDNFDADGKGEQYGI
jgi:hypothetical protein